MEFDHYFLAINIVSSLATPIPDCDEVFNYWEPLHFMIHGDGQQTWEYSPDYALRSYLYIILHAAPGYLLSFILPSKVHQFYCLRILFGLFNYYCLRRFMQSLNASYWSWVMLVTSTGITIAGHTLLPSTFTMNCLCLAIACLLTNS